MNKYSELDEQDISELKAKGYEIIKKAGEGCTRRVYEAVYKNGNLQKTRVLKIPRKDLPDDSIWTRIINMKRENNENNLLELKAASKISHENIEETLDTFMLNGRVINVGEFVDGWNLYEFVKVNRGISRETTNSIMSQLLNAECYLQDKDILHRDLKPTNVLVEKNGKVKLTDLQTATTLDTIMESMLPTRGGASYTHPKLLNAVLTDKPFKADSSTEAHSLGTILFYCLTGKELFDYKLVQDPNGKQINIGKDKINVSLMSCGKLTDRISEEEHDKFVKKAIKEVPRPYRKILEKSLKFSSSYGIEKFKGDLEGINFAKEKAWQKAGRMLRNGAYIALAGFCLGMGFDILKESAVKQDLSIYSERAIKEAEHFKSDAEHYEHESASDIVDPFLCSKYIKEFKNKKEKIKEFVDLSQWLADRSNFDKKLIKSMILSAALEDSSEIAKEYKDGRWGRFAVPTNFVLVINKGLVREPPSLKGGGVMAARYLVNCYNYGDDPSDVLMKYFCSNDEWITAKALAGNKDYSTGYRQYIPAVKQRLIDRALTLYYSMDKNGEIPASKNQKISPDSGLAAR